MNLPNIEIPGTLISLPSLKNSYFEKTVILLCNYNEEGAMGLVMNHPTDTLVREILQEEPPENSLLDQSLLIGGPVQPDTFWAVHSTDFESESSTQLSSGIGLSSAQEVINALNRNERPKICHLGCGYSGWGPRQLDDEIQKESWWLSPLDENLLLHMNYNDRWETSLKNLGFDLLTAEYIKSGTV